MRPADPRCRGFDFEGNSTLEQLHLHQFSCFSFFKDIELSPDAVVTGSDLEVAFTHSQDTFSNLLAHDSRQVRFSQLKEDLPLRGIAGECFLVKILHSQALATFNSISCGDDLQQRDRFTKRSSLEPTAANPALLDDDVEFVRRAGSQLECPLK